MNQAEYENVAGGLMQLARDIEDSKRPGYTRGDDDVLVNFKRVGERLGISTEQAWGTYFLKHIDAILSIMTQPELAVSEEPAGRFADAINYLRLGYALLRERDLLEYVPEVGSPVPDMCVPTFAEITPIFTAPSAEYSQEFVAVPHGGGYGVTLAAGSKMGQR